MCDVHSHKIPHARLRFSGDRRASFTFWLQKKEIDGYIHTSVGEQNLTCAWRERAALQQQNRRLTILPLHLKKKKRGKKAKQRPPQPYGALCLVASERLWSRHTGIIWMSRACTLK